MEYKRIDVLKTIVVLTLFVLTFICGLVPFVLRKAAANAATDIQNRGYLLLFSLLSCAGGGIFLATCLLDLLPEAHEKLIDGLIGLGYIKDSASFFPLSEFFVAIGFFIILILEQIGVYFKERSFNEDDVHAVTEKIRRPSAISSTLEGVSNRPRLSVVSRTRRVKRNSSQGSHIDDDFVQSNSLAVPSAANVNAAERLLSTQSVVNYGATYRQLSSSSEDENSDENDLIVEVELKSQSVLRAVLLVAALSLHSCFEGLALGVQQETSKLLQLFGALAIHKSVISFSLGMRLVQSSLSTPKIVLCNLVFCSLALVGGIIGILISEGTSNRYTDVVNGSLQGIAAGTFMYITFFEILPHELNSPQYRLWKLIMVIFGFSVIVVFVIFFPS